MLRRRRWRVSATMITLAALMVLAGCDSPAPTRTAPAAGDHAARTTKASSEASAPAHAQRMQWWRDARYGMFIHWGPYAVSGGEWNGRDDYGEWMMSSAKIPMAEYRHALVENFSGKDFDAAQWVRLAKDAGMQYIVFTAKHHDGFAMFDTDVSDYNIVDAAPFGRDPVRELAEEARRQGIRFGIYYSHILDWSSPDATPDSFNNTWDFKLDQARFDRYWDRTVLPHVTELLTRYGDIAEVWFDIGKATPADKTEQLLALVRKLQPGAVVNNRIKSFADRDYGDFVSMGDNEIPQAGYRKDFESAMTLNNHWGYNRADQHWKSADAVVLRLVDVASKGGNLLLNVGPTGEGVIPQRSQQILRDAGKWLQRNGQAIHATRPLRTPYEFDWGALTVKGSKVYLLVSRWSPQLILHGLDATVTRAHLLHADDRPLTFSQDRINGTDVPRLRLQLPRKAPDHPVSVVVLETSGPAATMRQQLIQQGDGGITLNLAAATLTAGKAAADNQASWTFDVFTPGEYAIDLTSLQRDDAALAYTAPVRVDVSGQRLQVQPTEDQRPTDLRSTQHPYHEVISHLGRLQLAKPGTYTLTLHSDLAIPDATARGIPWQQDRTKLRSLRLRPTNAASR